MFCEQRVPVMLIKRVGFLEVQMVQGTSNSCLPIMRYPSEETSCMNEQNSCSLHLETKVLSNAAITSKVLYAFTAKCEEMEGGHGDRKVDKENVLKW